MNLQLGEVLPRIYHLRMSSAYDLAMHFLRAQEYYESPKFRGRLFTLVEYMEWYSKEKGSGAFTYPKDWSGFNVPSSVLLEVYGKPGVIPDPNKYDALMSLIVARLDEDAQKRPFYLIGTSGTGDDEGALYHEIAHGLYYTDRKYRNQMNELLKKMDSLGHRVARIKAGEILSKMGYHYSVCDDELQAYCATGPCTELEGVLTSEVRGPFTAFFGDYVQELFSARAEENTRRGA